MDRHTNKRLKYYNQISGLWVQFPPSAPNDRNIGSTPLMIAYRITQCSYLLLS